MLEYLYRTKLNNRTKAFQKIEEAKQKGNTSFDRNIDSTDAKSDIYRIGNRKNTRYGRLYTRNDTILRFEYEMKGKTIKKYSNYLISNSFQKFENLISRSYIFFLTKDCLLIQSM